MPIWDANAGGSFTWYATGLALFTSLDFTPHLLVHHTAVLHCSKGLALCAHAVPQKPRLSFHRFSSLYIFPLSLISGSNISSCEAFPLIQPGLVLLGSHGLFLLPCPHLLPPCLFHSTRIRRWRLLIVPRLSPELGDLALLHAKLLGKACLQIVEINPGRLHRATCLCYNLCSRGFCD